MSRDREDTYIRRVGRSQARDTGLPLGQSLSWERKILFILLFMVPRIEPRASDRLGKHSTIKLHSQPWERSILIDESTPPFKDGAPGDWADLTDSLDRLAAPFSRLPATPPQLIKQLCLESDGELIPNHRQGAQQSSTWLSRLGHSIAKSKQTKSYTSGQGVENGLGANPNQKPHCCAVVLTGLPFTLHPAKHCCHLRAVMVTALKPQSHDPSLLSL